MRIPAPDNFGQAQPNLSRGAADTRGLTAGTEAIGRLAGTAASAAMQQIQQDRQEYLDLNRAKALNSKMEYLNHLSNLESDIQDQVNTGRLDYQQSVKEFEKLAGGYEHPRLDLPPAEAEQYNGYIRSERERFALRMQGFQKVAQKRDFQNQFYTGLDNISKLAAHPGANIPTLNGMADDFVQDAIEAGMPEAEVRQRVSQFNENNWTRQAEVRLIQNKDNRQQLEKLHDDLIGETGFYLDKIGIDRRNGLLNSVANQLYSLDYKQQRQADKRNSTAAKAINEIERQISTGVPATPSMWKGWADTVKGSQYESDFDQLADDELQVQKVLRLPVDQQLQYIQEQDAQLKTGGGDLREIANQNRLRAAVDRNVKQLQNDPLLFDQARTGNSVVPLDAAMLVDPAASPVVAATMRDRVTTIRALQNRYGSQVKMRPLLPQEAQLITSALKMGGPSEQAGLFSKLRSAFGDDESYVAAMQQIAPDAPVKALAGMIMAKERSMTMERNWFRDDVIASSGNVAATLLIGEAMLNKTTDQKAMDGSGKQYPIPTQTDFDVEFSAQVGNAFAGRPDAYGVAMQAVRAYYTGRSAQEGDVSGVVDSKRMRQAVRAVLGNAVDVNGNGEAFAPWGMSESDFEDKAEAAFTAEMKRRGMEKLSDRFGLFGLRNASGESYYVLQGRNYLLDSSSNPVVINLAGGAP